MRDVLSIEELGRTESSSSLRLYEDAYAQAGKPTSQEHVREQQKIVETLNQQFADAGRATFEAKDPETARQHLLKAVSAADQLDMSFIRQQRKDAQSAMLTESDPNNVRYLSDLDRMLDGLEHAPARSRLALAGADLELKNYAVAQKLIAAAEELDPEFCSRPQVQVKLMKSLAKPETIWDDLCWTGRFLWYADGGKLPPRCDLGN